MLVALNVFKGIVLLYMVGATIYWIIYWMRYSLFPDMQVHPDYESQVGCFVIVLKFFIGLASA